MFFWTCQLIKCMFLIGLRAQSRLTCCKQGQVVRNKVNANSGLEKLTEVEFFIDTNVFHCFCFVYFDDLEIIQTQAEDQTTLTENLAILQLKSVFLLILC